MSFIGHENFKVSVNTTDATTFDNSTNPVFTVSNQPQPYTGATWLADINDANEGCYWSLANKQTVIQGARIAHDTNTTSLLFSLRDGTTHQVTLYCDFTNKVVKVYRGNSSGTLLGTSSVIPSLNALTGVMSTTSSTYIEWKVVIDNSVGSIEVRANGSSTPVLSLTGIDTQNTGNAFATKGNFYAAGNRVTDIYLLDGDGASPWNSFLGEYRVITLFPSGDNSVQFTRNTGATNAAAVDDQYSTGQDDDTTYVEDNTAGHIDWYDLDNLPAGLTPSVVQIRGIARKTDAGVREWRMKIDSGGSIQNGTTQALGSSYTLYKETYLTDPTDSNAWTETKVNALKLGHEVVT